MHATGRDNPPVSNAPLDAFQSKNYCKSWKGDVIGSSTVIYSSATASWITNGGIQHGPCTHTQKIRVFFNLD